MGILSLNGGSPRTANAVYKLQSSLATQPSPAPCSRVRVTLMELMMKLHIAKVICLKLLRKLDKALQNYIFRGFWSAKPCKSELQHCGVLEEITANSNLCVHIEKELLKVCEMHVSLPHLPTHSTLPDACTGISYRTFFNWGVSRSAQGPARAAVWGHVHAQTQRQVTL